MPLNRVVLIIFTVLNRNNIFIVFYLFIIFLINAQENSLAVKINGHISNDNIFGWNQMAFFHHAGDSGSFSASHQESDEKGVRSASIIGKITPSEDSNGNPKIQIEMEIDSQTSRVEEGYWCWYGIGCFIENIDIFASASTHQVKITQTISGSMSTSAGGPISPETSINTSDGYSDGIKSQSFGKSINRTISSDWMFCYKNGKGDSISDLIHRAEKCNYNKMGHYTASCSTHAIKSSDLPANSNASVKVRITIEVLTRQVKPINFKKQLSTSTLQYLNAALSQKLANAVRSVENKNIIELINPSDKHIFDHMYVSLSWESSTGDLNDLKELYISEALRCVDCGDLQGAVGHEFVEVPAPFKDARKTPFFVWVGYWEGWVRRRGGVVGDGLDKHPFSEIDIQKAIQIKDSVSWSLIQEYHWMAPWLRDCDGSEITGTAANGNLRLKRPSDQQLARNTLLLSDKITRTVEPIPTKQTYWPPGFSYYSKQIVKSQVLGEKSVDIPLGYVHMPPGYRPLGYRIVSPEVPLLQQKTLIQRKQLFEGDDLSAEIILVVFQDNNLFFELWNSGNPKWAKLSRQESDVINVYSKEDFSLFRSSK